MNNEKAINQINDVLIANLEEQIKCHEGYVVDLKGRLKLRDAEIEQINTELDAMKRTMNGAIKEAAVYRDHVVGLKSAAIQSDNYITALEASVEALEKGLGLTEALTNEAKGGE